MKRAFLIDFENVKSAGLVGLEDLTATDEVIILYSVNSNTLSFEMHQKIMQCPACVDYYQIKRGGKNSLDFQLSSLLGYLLGSGEYSHLYVVSNDSGFDVLRNFWTSGFIDTECVVYRRVTLASCLNHISLLEKENTELEEYQGGPLEENDQSILELLETEDITVTDNEPEKMDVFVEETPATQPAEAEKKKASTQPTKPIDPKPQVEPIGHGLSQEMQKEVMEILSKTEGKQEFYRKLIAKYGQKKGLETYKILKPDYSNLKNKISGVR